MSPGLYLSGEVTVNDVELLGQTVIDGSDSYIRVEAGINGLRPEDSDGVYDHVVPRLHDSVKHSFS